MMKAENERSKIILDLNRRVFAKFSKRNEHWEQVTHCLTILDVLCSLASYAVLYAEEVCMPKMKPFSDNVITAFYLCPTFLKKSLCRWKFRWKTPVILASQTLVISYQMILKWDRMDLRIFTS